MKLRITLVLIALLALPGSAMAQDPIHKFGRGIVNVLTSWIEIPKQVHMGSRQDNPITGTISGLGKGIANAILRLGVGLYEAVSCPIPYPKGYVSPYEGMRLPDYAWE